MNQRQACQIWGLGPTRRSLPQRRLMAAGFPLVRLWPSRSFTSPFRTCYLHFPLSLIWLRQRTAERGSSLDFEKSPSQPTSPLTTTNHPLSTPVSPLLTADAILGTAPLPPLLDLSLSCSSTLATSFLATLPPCTCPPPSTSHQHHAESQKRKRDRAVALLWAPLLLLMVALALFRVFVSNEEMDRIVDQVVVVNVEVVAYVRDTVCGLRHGVAGFGGGGDTGVGIVGDGHGWWQGGGSRWQLVGYWWQWASSGWCCGLRAKSPDVLFICFC
ncbi:hypothetical protein DFJ73DRAFT_265384 [Zopfochytrium polystomum]|nr:hypothetical protein DFJ73DRAFT_265384 [Zopfochytrium polystomum]